MLDLGFVHGFVQENFPNTLITRNGTHFNFRCPFCGDSEKNKYKRRFHLQYDSETDIYFQCFNCYIKGSFYDLYAEMSGVSSEEAYKELNKFNADFIKKRLLEKNKIDKKILNFHTSNNFSSFLKKKCLKEGDKTDSKIDEILLEALRRFKEKRKITNELYVCNSGTFNKRIIIPIFEDGRCVFFQGRRIVDTMEPKYLNPSTEKENIILNKGIFEKDRYIIVVEGILDAFTIGPQGTTCLGAHISDAFIGELFKYTDKGVIIALDNDKTGIQRMYDIIKKSDYNKRLNYFFLQNYKDLNEAYVENDISDIYKYVVDGMDSYLNAYIKIRGIF